MRWHNETDRRTDIDIAKGLLILLVVLGHLMTMGGKLPYAIKAITYSFHMPAFFVISGILTNTERITCGSFFQFVKKKARRLLVPYVFFEVTGGLWQMLLMGTESVNPVEILWGILTIHCHVGADWFLPTMFFAEIILFLIVKYFRKELYPFVPAVCFMVAFLVPDINYVVACCRRVLVALAFILCGMVWKRYFIKKSMLGVVLSGITVVLVACFNGVADLSVRQFGNPLLYVIGGIVGSYLVLNLSKYLGGVLAKIFARIGCSSLVIMGTHQNIQIAFNTAFGSTYTLPVFIFAVIVTLLCELIIVPTCEKYIPFLVGAAKNSIKG